ncbi:MAG: Asp23/Gls24 family envelope stress response protein [Synergistaceae bacterium]|nr:Asp23/Gls24 family envelope stress response protein [Synergistaceae bacterium]
MSDNDEKKSQNGGLIHISEDVIAELARKTIQGIPNIKTAGIAQRFNIGRKTSGIKVSVVHSQGKISVVAYVLVKYGQRIPDLAWDVQEKIKDNLERYTGYNVNAVNVNVQGIYTSSGDDIGMSIEKDEPSPDNEAD